MLLDARYGVLSQGRDSGILEAEEDIVLKLHDAAPGIELAEYAD